MKMPKIKSLNCLLVFLLLELIFGWCDFREFVILLFLQKYKYLRYVHKKYNHLLMEETKILLPKAIGAFQLTKM